MVTQIMGTSGTRGSVEESGSRKTLRNKKGKVVGWFDGHNTFNASGQRIGAGDQLLSLLED